MIRSDFDISVEHPLHHFHEDRRNDKKRIIYVVGAQCTGKTTLTNALRERLEQHAQKRDRPDLQPVVINEVAREVFPKLGLTGNNIRDSREQVLHMQRAILEAQWQAEEKVTAGWYISDRSAIDALMYVLHYGGAETMAELKQLDAWKNLVPRLKDAFFVLCEPVPGWLHADGMRIVPSEAEWFAFHERFVHFMRHESPLDQAWYLISHEKQELDKLVDNVLRKWSLVDEP